MKNYIQILSFGLLAGLAACGSDPAPVVVAPPVTPTQVPTTPVNLPAPTTAGGDYVRDVVAPWLQSYYGLVSIQTSVQIMANGVAIDTLAPGEYQWRDIYDRTVTRLAQACQCSYTQGAVQNFQQIGNLSSLAYIDYSRFSQFTSANSMAWQQAAVTLRPTWNPQQVIYANFAFIFHQLVSMNHSYYTQYYYPVMAGGVNYMPGTWGFGNYYGNSSALSFGLGYNSFGGSGGRNLSLNVGGFFNGF